MKPKKRGKTIVKDTPAISITEKARQRHEARSKQQERDIQRKWTLRRAKIRHRARTDEEIKAIKDKWEERNHLKFREVVLRAGKYGIDYHQVHNLSKFLNDKEIIERIGGGDLTEGSCSSLAFAYAGCKNGFDVIDFRGGASQGFFSRSSNIMSIAEMAGGKVESNVNDFTKAKSLLGHVEKGKDYYFTCGEHAAIIRKTDNGFEYLELQSANDNGFKPLNDNVLKRMFGAKRSHSLYKQKYETKDCLIDISFFKDSQGFRKLLGYINTAESSQLKGVRGTIK